MDALAMDPALQARLTEDLTCMYKQMRAPERKRAMAEDAESELASWTIVRATQGIDEALEHQQPLTWRQHHFEAAFQIRLREAEEMRAIVASMPVKTRWSKRLKSNTVE